MLAMQMHYRKELNMNNCIQCGKEIPDYKEVCDACLEEYKLEQAEAYREAMAEDLLMVRESYD